MTLFFLFKAARGIGRLGDDLVSHREQARVTRQAQKLRQGFQALSDKIDLKIKELLEMNLELAQLDERIHAANNESDLVARVLKEVSRAPRADKTLLEERRERLKISQVEIRRAEREIKESGEKAALKVLNRCGDENGRAVRERLATAQRRAEFVCEETEKEERKLSRMIELIGDFEIQADHLENEIQNLQNPKTCEVKLSNLRESASYLLDSGSFSDHSPVTLRLDRLNRMLTSASEQCRERRNALENEKKRETEREREFEVVKAELAQLDVIPLKSLANLPNDLKDLDNLISRWENLEPKLEYLETLNESPNAGGQPNAANGSLRRRSRKHRTSTLPRNIRNSLTLSGSLGVEGLRLKYESIGDRIINTRNIGQILLEQLEVWHSSQVKAEHIIKDLEETASLLSATGDVAEAVRAGKAVIQTCKTKLDKEPADLPQLEEEVEHLQNHFNDVQQRIFDDKMSKERHVKDLDQFQSRLTALSDWTNDQWSLMSVLGKISADPAILEPQRQQVEALLSEFHLRKDRFSKLQSDVAQLENANKEREVQQLSSRWADLEKKLEERKISIEEALKCTIEIENETRILQDFLTKVTSDMAGASRLPPVPETVASQLAVLKSHQSEIPKMEESAQLAQQAAEFLAQVAAGAENHGTKSQSASHALRISAKKLDEKVTSLDSLLTNLTDAYATRNKLFEALEDAEQSSKLKKSDIDCLRRDYEKLVTLVEHISENTSPVRNNSLREDKRAIQRRLKALETTIDQRSRDESRRARKQAQLIAFISERETALANTAEGEARPETIHQKMTLVQTISDELNARATELSTPLDPEVKVIHFILSYISFEPYADYNFRATGVIK